jgi:hypothetical protein
MDFDISRLSVGQLAQFGAWGLALGTLFFGCIGIRADKDFFLMLGLVCTFLGNLGFAFFLFDQDEGTNNETMITIFVLFAIFSIYALTVQWWKFRTEGCDGDDDDEAAKAAGDAFVAPPPAPAVANASAATTTAVKRK